jgi:ribosomal protein S1
LHHSRIGASGVVDAADYLAVGDEIDVVVDEIGPVNDGAIRILCSARSLKTLSPEEKLQESFPIGESYPAMVVSLADYGVFVRVDGVGTDCLVHRSKIGPGVVDPRRVVTVGDSVEVTVLSYKSTARGPSLDLAAPHVSTPTAIDQLRDVVGDTPTGTVGQVRANGVSVTLAEGTSARVPGDRLGSGGALDPTLLIAQGETLTIRLLSAEWRDGQLEVRAEARDYPTGSLLEQARGLFAARPRVRGQAGRLLPIGRLVRISHGLNALVRFRNVDVAGRALLENLSEGDDVFVEVFEVREGAGPRGLQLEARLRGKIA